MKDHALMVFINQIACAINEEIKTENDLNRQCNLQDAKEYVRRAWHCLADIPCEDNDTTRETFNIIHGK